MDAQEKLYFTSSYTIGKKEHKEMNCISYQTTARDIRIVAILTVLAGVVLPVLAEEFSVSNLMSSALLFFASVLFFPFSRLYNTKKLYTTGGDHRKGKYSLHNEIGRKNYFTG